MRVFVLLCAVVVLIVIIFLSVCFVGPYLIVSVVASAPFASFRLPQFLRRSHTVKS